jgi:N4-bis(aminopropyl)spermidine synthase
VNEKDFDIRAAANAVSDVVQNRPRPLREFDQIYMKAGDMVLQATFVAQWTHGKRVAFIGDGDGISLAVAYLYQLGIIDRGPTQITVFDFDERICNSITRFAEAAGLQSVEPVLYNCLDAFPRVGQFDAFYTNPPWGKSNAGASVQVFVQRGLEAIGFAGEGNVVLADDPDLEWSRRILANIQSFALAAGFYVQRMQRQMHQYHLDDNPNLQSCNLLFRSVSVDQRVEESQRIRDPNVLRNFYGQDQPARVAYVRESHYVGYGEAHPDEYRLEELGP